MRRISLAVGTALIAGCAMGPRAMTHASASGRRDVASLARTIDSLVDTPDFSNANWGILIVDPVWGDTLYSRNAGKLFMPASNMKLLTTATALTQLGPEYTFRTAFMIDGDSVAVLSVLGFGDPTVSDHMRRDAMIPLREIADSVVAHGVRHVSALELAADFFPGPVLGFGWSWEDLESSYSAATD